MVKRFLLVLLASLIIAGGLPAVSSAAAIKIATIAPEGSDWMREMRRGAETIRERTEGRVEFKFYGGGVMGNEKSVLRKIRIGQLQGGAFTGGGLVEVYPDFALYSLPLQFQSLAEIDAIRKEFDPILLQGLEEAGFVSFGLAEGGFAELMAGTPVRTLDELRGRKVWVPEGDEISYAVMSALGLAPVTLPITDVLTGLQTSLIEIVGTSPIGALAFQWHTRVKYITDAPLLYLFATLVIDKRAFSRLSEGDQKIVREVMAGVYDQFDRQNRIDNEAALQAMLDQGLVLVEPEGATLKEMRATADRVISGLAEEGEVSLGLYRQMEDRLKDLRSTKAPSVR